MRKIEIDPDGQPRFQRNAIVSWLVHTDRVDLNEIIATHAWPIKDQEEFWQMLGYSVSAFGNLTFVRPKTTKKADRRTRKLLRKHRVLRGL